MGGNKIYSITPYSSSFHLYGRACVALILRAIGVLWWRNAPLLLDYLLNVPLYFACLKITQCFSLSYVRMIVNPTILFILISGYLIWYLLMLPYVGLVFEPVKAVL